MKGESFFFKRGKVACLLVHGLTSSSQEVLELGQYLADKGFTVKGVLLRGHNTSVSDLDKTTWEDWFADVVEGWKLLSKSYNKIYVIGISMGAVLSLHLAASYQVSGVVALAPALFFKSWKTKFVPFIKHFIRYHKKNYNKYYPREYSPWDIVSDSAYLERVAYKTVPLRAFDSSLKLIEIVKNELSRITVPVLVMHSKKDNTVLLKSTDYVYDNIGSSNKKKIILEKSGHVITVDVEKKKVFKSVIDFLVK